MLYYWRWGYQSKNGSIRTLRKCLYIQTRSAKLSVVEPAEGELFVIRTHKFHTLNPSLTWVNNYEFRLLLGLAARARCWTRRTRL